MKQRPVHLLTSRWSLHYIMTGKEWECLRDTVRKQNPVGQACACPKKRPATQLHETWVCNRRTHTKKLTGLVYLCASCHGRTNEGWLPAGPFDLNEFLDGRVDFTKPVRFEMWQPEPDSSYYTPARYAKYMAAVSRLGRALSDVRTGKALLKAYRVNLTALSKYGYSRESVTMYERRAMARTLADLRALQSRIRSEGQSLLLFEHDGFSDSRNWSRVAFSLEGSGLYTR